MGAGTDVLRAMHPIPAAFVTALSTVVVVALGGTPVDATWTCLSTALGQACVGLSNDYVDRERDADSGRTDKPVALGEVPAGRALRAAIAAGLLCPLVALPLGALPALMMSVAVASALLYNAPLKATALSWLPFAISFGLLPAFAWGVARDGMPPGWILLAAGGLGVAAHLMNSIPDLDDDAATGIRGLPHRLGARWSLCLATLILAVELAVVAQQTEALGDPLSASAATLAFALVSASGIAAFVGRSRWGWHLTLAATAAIAIVFLTGMGRTDLR